VVFLGAGETFFEAAGRCPQRNGERSSSAAVMLWNAPFGQEAIALAAGAFSRVSRVLLEAPRAEKKDAPNGFAHTRISLRHFVLRLAKKMERRRPGPSLRVAEIVRITRKSAA